MVDNNNSPLLDPNFIEQASAGETLAEALSSGSGLVEQLAVSQREGNGLTEEGLGADLVNMSYGQLATKYGEDVAANRINIQKELSNQRRVQNAERTPGQILADTALGAASGAASLIGGGTAATLGVAGEVDQFFDEEKTGFSEAGVAVSEFTNDATEFFQGLQSGELQDRKRISNIEAQLDAADSLAQYERDIADGDSAFVASLSRVGRDALNTGQRLASDGAVTGDVIAQALGSLGPSAKVAQATSKALVGVSRPLGVGQQFATTVGAAAGVGAAEASGAYMDTVSNVMARTHDEMLNSPEYTAMIADGMDPIRAQEIVAASTGVEAFGRQFPTAMALTIASGANKFNTNPVQAVQGGFVDKLSEIGKQALEEAAQGASGQFNQNVAIQNQVDANQSLVEGVGEQAATGAIAGAGMAAALGGVSAPIEATQAVVNTASGAVNAGVELASSVGETVRNAAPAVSDALGSVAETVNQKVPAAAEALETIKNAGTQTLQRIQDFAESSDLTRQVRDSALAKSIEIQASEFATRADETSIPAALAEVATNVKDNVIPSDLADSIPSAGTVVENVSNLIQSFAQPNKNLSRMSDSAILFASENFEALKAASNKLPEEIKNNVSKIISSPDFQKVQDLASKIDLNKTHTAETEVSPENVSDTVRVAKTNPTNVNPDFVNKILEQPAGIVSPENLHILRAASEVSQHVNGHAGEQVRILNEERVALSQKPAYQANPKRLDELKPEAKIENVSRSVQVAGFKGARSVNDYAADIFKAAQSPDQTFTNKDGISVPAASVIQEFRMFAEHMANKTEALARSAANVNERGKGSEESFRSLSLKGRKMVEPGQAGAAAPVVYNANSEKAVKFARNVANDARVTAEVYNTMARTFPNLFPDGEIQIPTLEIANNEQQTVQEVSETSEPESQTDTETRDQQEETGKEEEQVVSETETVSDEDARDDVDSSTETTETEDQTTAPEASDEVGDLPEAQSNAEEETTSDQEEADAQSVVEDEITYDVPAMEQDIFRPTGREVEYTDGATLIDMVENVAFKDIAKKLLRPMTVRMNQRLKTVKFNKSMTVAEALADESVDPTAIRDYKNTLFVNRETLQYDPALLSLAAATVIDWMSSARATDPAQLQDTLEDLGVDYAELSEENMENIMYGVSPRQAAETIARTVTKVWNLQGNPDASMLDTRGSVESLVKELLTVSADMGLVEINQIPAKDGRTADTINVKRLQKMHEKIGLDGQNAITKLLAPEDVNAPSIGNRITSTDQTQSRGSTPLSDIEKKALKRMQDTPHFISEGVTGFVTSLGFDALNNILGFRSTDTLGERHPLRASIAGKNLSIERDYQDAMAVVDAINNTGSDEQVPVFYPVGISKVGRHQFKGINPQNNKILRAMVTPTHSTLDMTNQDDYNAFWLTVSQAADLRKVENENHNDILSTIEDEFNARFGEATDLAQNWVSTGELDVQAFSEAMGTAEMAELSAVVAVAQYRFAKENGTEAEFQTTLSFELDGKTDGPANMMSNFGQGEVSVADYENFKRVGFFLGSKEMTLNSHFASAQSTGDLYEVTSSTAQTEMVNRIANAKGAEKATLLAVRNFSAAFGDMKIKDGEYVMTRSTSKSPMTKTVYGSGVRGVAAGIAQDMILEFYERMIDVPAGQDPAQYLGYPTLAEDFQTIFGESLPKGANWAETYLDKESMKRFEDIVTKGMGDILSTTAKRVIGDKITNVNDTLVFLTGVQTHFLQNLFQRRLEELAEKRAAEGKIARNKQGKGIISQLSNRDYNNLVRELRAYAPTYSNGTQTLAVGSFDNQVSDIELSSNMDGRLRMKSNMAAPALAGVKVIPYLSIGRGDAMMMNTIYSAENAPTDTLPVFDGIDMPVSRVKDYANQINEAVMQNWDRDVLADVEADFENFLSSVGSDTDLLAEAFAATKEAATKSTVTAANADDLLASLKEMHRQNQARKAAFKQIPVSVDHMGGSDSAYTRGKDVTMDLGEINRMIRENLDGVAEGQAEVGTPDLVVASAGTMAQAVLKQVKNPELRKTVKAILPMLPANAKVVRGTLAQLRAYRAENYASDGQSLVGANGMFDVENNVIFLTTDSTETLVHELVHMATFNNVLAHYEGQTSDAVVRLEGLMDEFINLDFSKETSEMQTAANQMIASVVQNQNSSNAMSKASALNEFMAWTLSNDQLIAKAKRTETKTLTQKIWALMSRILGNVPKDIFSNVLFNASIVNQPDVQDTEQDNGGDDGDNDDGGVTPTANRFQNYWINLMRKRLEESKIATGEGKQDKLVRYVNTSRRLVQDLDFGGFNQSEYQKQTFMAIHAILATELTLDARSSVAIQKLFDHVTSNLSPTMFGSVDADERFQTVMDMFGNTSNDEGMVDAIAVFLALSQTSNGFRSALEQIPAPETEVHDGSLNSFLEEITATLMNKALGSVSIDGNPLEVLDSLSESLIEVKGDQEYAALKGIMSNISKANSLTANAMTLLADKVDNFNEDFKKSDAPEFAKLATGAVTIASSFLSEQHTKDAAQGVKNFAHMGTALDKLVPIREFIVDIVGTDKINASIVALLDRTNFAVSSARQAFREELPNVLARGFQNKPTKEQWSQLHSVLGKTDFANLFDQKNPDASMRLLVSESRLNKRIEAAEKAIVANFSKTAADAILEKAQQLANFMNGNGAGHQLWKNAYAINMLAGEFNDSMTGDIDNLVSMYALQGRDSADKAEVVNLYNADPEGVTNLVVYMQALNKQEDLKQSSVSEEARLNGYKGYLPSQGSGGSHLAIFEDSEEESLLRKGYVRVATATADKDFSNISRGYYTTTVKQGGLYSQGVMQSVRASYRGVDPETGRSADGSVSDYITGDAIDPVTEALNKAGLVKNDKEVLIPVQSADGIIGYERALNPDLVEKYTAPSNNLALSLGAWAGRQVEEEFGRRYNIELINSLKEIWDKREPGSDGLFIDLSDTNDVVFQDSWNVLSSETKDAIEEIFGEGEGFMIRKDMVNLTVGYREPSVVDMWSGKTRMPKAVQIGTQAVTTLLLGKKANARMSKLEEGGQAVISTAKDIIVVRSLVVPAMNATSNFVQLVARGVPIKAAIKGTRDKLVEIEAYNENVIKLIELDARIQLANASGDTNEVSILKTQKEAINTQNERMSIAPVIKAGAYKNISEGITDMDVEITSGRLAEWVEEQVDKIPPKAQMAAKYAMLSKDTAIYRGANKAVQYGDFIAKSIYYDQLVSQGKTHDEAVTEVNEEFVNFSVLPGRTRSYWETIGGSWFMTYKIRIMKIALKTLQNNPLGALITGGMFPEVGNPIDDNLLSVAMEGRLDYSLGTDMLFSVPELNPWVNLIDSLGD